MIKKKRVIAIICIFLCIIANTVPRYIHYMNFNGRSVYYEGQALSFSFLFLAALLISPTKLLSICLDFGFGLSLNNTYDECWGDPLKLGWNEVVFAAGLTIYFNVKLLTWHRETKRYGNNV